MLNFSVKHDFAKTEKSLTGIAKQVPFATALALTKTAQAAQTALKQEMRSVFDQPKPFTINSLRVEPAKKDRLQARVHYKDFAGKGTPAGRYLSAQVEGGDRNQKSSEKALGAWMAHAGMGSSGFWVPGSGIKLDRHGNVPGGQLTKILSFLKSNPDALQNITNSKRSRAKRRGVHYFVSPANSHLFPAINIVKDGKVSPALILVNRLSYKKRFDFYGVGERVFDEQFEGQFWNAIIKAMGSAR